MTESQIIHRRIHFHAAGRRRILQEGPAENRNLQPDGRIPRVARLMALAIRLKDRANRECPYVGYINAGVMFFNGRPQVS